MAEMSYKEKAALFMDRFRGRPDVYGKEHVSKEGKKAFYPVCENFWEDGCNIKLKNGKGCSGCTIKKHKPVSEETVLKHIKGEEFQNVYVLQEDFYHYFGALDFDCKPGKEETGYHFKDVQLTSQVLTKFGIKNYIARSTGDGFHIYMYFDEAVASNVFRTVMFHVFKLTGFVLENQQGIRFLPEVFPKQCNGGIGGIGNAIKPPMIEPRFKVERNCFVDGENHMIPAELQWDYLAKTEKNPASLLEEIRKEEGLELREELGTGIYGSSSAYSDGSPSSGKWVRPLTGSIEKLVHGCTAFRKLTKKIEKGHVASHNEGFALFHTGAMHTADGLEWFYDKVHGWSETDEQKRQLEHSLHKNYNPWTCRKMQENGVCDMGTKCFNKQPPIVQIEGQEVVDRSVPQSKWKDPSPIRYARNAGNADYLLKLQEEVKELQSEEDISIRGTQLKGIINRAQVFDISQQEALKKYITEDVKLGSKANINKMFKEAANDRTEDLKQKASEGDDRARHNDVSYQLVEGGGYAVMRVVKNQASITQICNVEILITEERNYIDDRRVVRLVYIGVVKSSDYRQEFEIETDAWADNSEFLKFFTKLCGTRFNVARQNLDHIRQAAICFSRKEGVEKTNYFVTQGWYEDMYLMPSVQIDDGGVKPNSEKKIDLSGPGKELASNLDFSILEGAELKATLFHIKSVMFKAFPRKPLFTALAHTLQAGIQAKVGVRQKAPMWVEGQTGTGKSSMLELLQQFWGKFDYFPNWTTNLKSILDYCYQFKDCCLVIDDYKGLTDQPSKAKIVLQYSYDPTIRGALKRDGTQRGDKFSRSLILCSGECTPTSEASAISRMILVRYPEVNKFNTMKEYMECKKHMKNYRGVTPRFIHYFLTKDIKEVKRRLEEITVEFLEPVQGSSNSTRIAGNYALNFLSWEMFVGFMLESGAIDHEEAKSLVAEHKTYCKELMDYTIVRCKEEGLGTLFAEILRDNLESGAATIRYLEGYNGTYGEEVGVIKKGDKDPDTVYLYPNVVVKFIKNAGKEQGLSGTASSFGEGLKSIGLLSKYGKDDVYCQTRINGRGPKKYLALDLRKLGLVVDKLKTVGGTDSFDIPMPEQPPLDNDGLLQ